MLKRKRYKTKLQKSGKWSRQFEACLECHLTFQKHSANGLCISCYAKNRRLRMYEAGIKYWKNWKQKEYILLKRLKREINYIHPNL